jgi:hypothetical protein
MQDTDLLNQAMKQPVPSIPMYYFHSFEQPFCTNPLCQCQLNRQAVIKLFVQIIEGKLELEQASRFSEGTV